MNDIEQLRLFMGIMMLFGCTLLAMFIVVAYLAIKYRLPLIGAPAPRPVPRFPLTNGDSHGND